MINRTNESGQASYDVVVIGAEERWEIDSLERRTTLIYKHLSDSDKVKKVLVITSPRSIAGRIVDARKHFKTMYQTHEVVSKGSRWLLARINPKLDMFCTTAIWPERDNLLSKWDREYLAEVIKGHMLRLGFENSILWISSPRIMDIVKKLPCRMRVFDAVDNLAIHPQFKRFHRKIKAAYRWAESKCDLICIASEKQKSMFPNRKDLFYLPNGIDDVFFENSDHRSLDDLRRLKRPLITYVGVMQERLDVDMLERVTEILSDCQFVFIGPELTPAYFNRLKAKPNVHFLGKKRYSEVPEYLRNSNVCIIPHKINEFTNSMDPLKIYEYLACGRPVVTTPVAGTERFSQYLNIAAGADSFANAIRKSLSEKDEARSSERQQAMAMHTWDHRVSDVLGEIGKMMDKDLMPKS